MDSLKAVFLSIGVTALIVSVSSAVIYKNYSPVEPRICCNFKYSQILDPSKKDNYWRMVMDGRFHKSGINTCDYGLGEASKEPGYMNAMLAAFNKMLDGLGTTLTPDKLDELHSLTVSNVKNMMNNCSGWREPKRQVFFRLLSCNSSKKGEEEFKNKAFSSWKSDRLTSNPDLKQIVIEKNIKRFYPVSPNDENWAKTYADIVLKEYYEKISSISPDNSEDKLRVIIRICQNLDQLHLFPDGNIRTIAFLVLNKLLMENGMFPTIMDNPNILDMKSTDEIMKEIIIGQHRFIDIFCNQS